MPVIEVEPAAALPLAGGQNRGGRIEPAEDGPGELVALTENRGGGSVGGVVDRAVPRGAVEVDD